MTEIAVVPRIRYPRDVRVGLSYLVTVDLDHSVPPGAWPYAEEEYPVICFLDAGSLFEHEPVGDRTIVVHRFGGSYGPVVFRLRACTEARGTMRVILADRVGLPIATISLDEIEIRTGLPVVMPFDESIVDLQRAFRPTALEQPADLGHGKVAPSRTRRGRALLVGAAMDGLLGVENDVRAMAEMLNMRGFDVDICAGTNATRQGILDRYNAFIADLHFSDAAVFYYSGHAFHGFEARESRSWQWIGPIDIRESTDNDFRGITAWELAILETQLTQRTKNVTVILDCAHASHAGRGGVVRDAEGAIKVGDAIPRTLPHPVRQGFAAHLLALRAHYGAAFDAVDPAGNRDVVRLVACMSHQSAFESSDSSGMYHGAFTAALLEVLREMGDARVSWALVIALVRERVVRRFQGQRPDVEGPARRKLFSLEQEAPNDAVTLRSVAAPLDRLGESLRIDAGHLMGVMPGDVYGVVSLADGATDVIAQVRIRETFATSADVDLVRPMTGDPVIPPSAIAVLIQKAVRRAVKIEVPDSAQESVKAALSATKRLRIAEPDDTAPLATLRLAGDVLTIEDALGPLFSFPRHTMDLRYAVENLANLAVAQGLREMEGEHGVLVDELEIEWGVVDQRRKTPLPEQGAMLRLHERIYVGVKSRAMRTLYAHLFSLGVRGKITLLTSFAPSGVVLTPEEPEFVLGQRSDGTLLGLGVSWPSDLPPASASRTEELVVVVTSSPVSLRNLETEERIVVAARNVAVSEEGIDSFFVRRLCYSLQSRDTVIQAFAIDDDPPSQEAAPIAAADAVEDEEQATPDDRSRTESDFGLVIGIEHYPHYRSLRGPANDAVRFHDWLCHSSGGGLPPQNAKLILSRLETMSPSQLEIDEALVALLQAADARGGGRRLYFYFSGHGATSPSQPGDDVALLLTRWSRGFSRLALSTARYADMLSEAGVFDELVMFIDCCRDVSIPIIGMSPTIAGTWVTPPRPTGVFLAYATKAGQSAFEARESDIWQGLFTRSLLSIFENANGISAHRLKERIERALDREAAARRVPQRAHVTNGLSPNSRFGVGHSLQSRDAAIQAFAINENLAPQQAMQTAFADAAEKEEQAECDDGPSTEREPASQSTSMKHTILFLAADPLGTDRLALDREARAIQVELERSGFRNSFALETRWVVEPLDLLRELRKLRPTVVHFTGHGTFEVASSRRDSAGPHRDVGDVIDDGPAAPARHGLYFQGADGRPQPVSADALEHTFGAAGSSVKLVVLSACYNELQAAALLAHVDCVVGMRGLIDDDAARSFAIGFYGGLGEHESVAAAFKQGRVAIGLEGGLDGDRPQLRSRAGVDPAHLVLASALQTSRPSAAAASQAGRSGNPPGTAPKVDIGILTIRDDEFRAVLAAFPDKAGTHKGASREYTLRHASIGDGQHYRVTVSRLIEQGNGEAQDAARDLIDDLAPRLILVVGIAGAPPSDDVKLGDVVISTRIDDFTVEARRASHEPTYTMTGGAIDKALAAFVTNLAAREDELGSWTADLPSPPPVTWTAEGQLYGPPDWQRELREKLSHHFGATPAMAAPTYTTGPIAASDRLVKAPELLIPWLRAARDLRAIEMESAGVYRAVRGRCPMLAIRGISDIVGLKRSDAWTKYACASAAMFTRAFLRTRPVGDPS